MQTREFDWISFFSLLGTGMEFQEFSFSKAGEQKSGYFPLFHFGTIKLWLQTTKIQSQPLARFDHDETTTGHHLVMTISMAKLPSSALQFLPEIHQHMSSVRLCPVLPFSWILQSLANECSSEDLAAHCNLLKMEMPRTSSVLLHILYFNLHFCIFNCVPTQ